MALYRNKVLLAKKEVTYGTDPTPTGADNAIQTSNLAIQIFQGNRVSRNLDRIAIGGDLNINTGAYTVISFDVEMAGSGTVDTAPAWGVLLEGCAMEETVNASTSVEYNPISDPDTFDSLTLYFNIDGELHKLTGARGNVAYRLGRGGYPYLNFTFTGLYNTPSEVSLPTPTLTAFQTALPVTNDNTPTYTIHGYAANAESMEINTNNNVVYRNVVNNESVIITDRAMTGSAVIEKPTLTQKDYYTSIIETQTTGAIQIVHGTSAGNIVQIDAPYVQLDSPNYSDSDGLVAMTLDMNLVPSSSGNDEFKITTK